MATLDEILGTGTQLPESQQVEEVKVSTDLPQPPATTSPQQQSQGPTVAEQSSTTATQPQRMSYSQMFQQMSPYKPPTQEDLDKERKKQKREAIFAAIGDGISSLSNLYFTTKGAPNAYDPSKGMSAKAKERYDKLKTEREANQRQYMSSYLQALKMDDDTDRADRNWRRQLERDAILDSRAEAKEKRDIAMADLNEKLKAHQITQAEYKAEQERIKSEYAGDYEKSRIDRNNAAGQASRASASASSARAESYRTGSNSSKKPSLKIGDETHTYDTTQDYDRAVEGYASEYGVDINEAITTGTGRRAKTTYRRKPTAQIAAEVEAASKQTPSVGW
ncbi:hypothetical protein LJB98_03285 [Bacteroidales bacterium OttesenSCG-928-M11]|nr:hypothetical protein [Bacteroidales bacterium OttesenSCG-928-M11]